MRKTDKKTDNAIRAVLTQACEIALDNDDGFQWLTHTVDYQHFPASLQITCVYDTQDSRNEADTGAMRALIAAKLRILSIQLDDVSRQVMFDSEEQCHAEHQGNWQRRLGSGRS